MIPRQLGKGAQGLGIGHRWANERVERINLGWVDSCIVVLLIERRNRFEEEEEVGSVSDILSLRYL